jgi:hypothetical protein
VVDFALERGCAVGRKRYACDMATSWLAPLKPVGRMGETLLDRVLCVAGAITLSQAPEFFQQYLQRLGGHLADRFCHDPHQWWFQYDHPDAR